MSDLSLPCQEDWLAHELLNGIALPAALYRDGNLLSANDAMQRLSGRDLPALQAMSATVLFAAEDRDALQQSINRCLEFAEVPPALSTRLVTPDGGERHVEISLRPVVLGNRRCAVLSCVDPSDFLHVQTSLFGMSEMLRQIVDGAPVASFVIDKSHHVTHWNRACERLTGFAPRQMIGTDEAWRAFYPNARPLLADLIVDGASEQELLALYGDRATFSALIPGGFEAEAFFPHFGTDGRWLFFTAAPLRDGNGQIVGAIETLQDVSQRHRAEEELLRHQVQLEQRVQERSAELATSARELTAFIDNAPIGVVYTSAGKVQRANRKLAELFGYPHTTVFGVAGADFYLTPEDFAELDRVAGPVLARGESLHHEMWMRHASGRAIWVQVNGHVADPAHTQQGTWWMMQDRTEMRSAQQQLQARFEELRETNRKLEETQNQLLQADKMASIGQLAAGVAHEINNPVGFVSSNLNTLRQYVDGLLSLVDAYAGAAAGLGQPQAAALDRLRDEVEIDYLKDDLPKLLDECSDGLGRVKKIVQDLKDFSRLDQAEWQQADLNAGLESTLNVVRHEVKYKAEVVKQLGAMPPVTCLAAQLNQVFLNLIVNAVHAIAERGVITLSSGTQDAWAWVQVTDTGCGMTEDVARRVFEPFFTTKEVGKGTGLGLSLSFSIAQKHNGVIQVHSAPGQGSSFRVWIPIDGPQSSEPGAAAPTWA